MTITIKSAVRTASALLRRVVLAILVAATAGASAEEPAVAFEYQIKASYLFNFLQFIKWPEAAFQEDGKFHLCVVGSERFGGALDPLDGEHVRGWILAVHALEDADRDSPAYCQVLYIAGEARSAVPSRFGLLTVGEAPGFLQRGGVINLVKVDGKVRFEINQNAARRAGLVISSRLLALAVN